MIVKPANMTSRHAGGAAYARGGHRRGTQRHTERGAPNDYTCACCGHRRTVAVARAAAAASGCSAAGVGGRSADARRTLAQPSNRSGGCLTTFAALTGFGAQIALAAEQAHEHAGTPSIGSL